MTCGWARQINPSTVPEVCMEKHLDLYDIDLAILTGGPYFTAVHPDVDYAAAYCRAFNDATLEHWVSKDKRFRASIQIAPQDPELAVAEINRLADNPKIAQVLMPAGARLPFGNRFYHPIYAAAEATRPAHLDPLWRRGRGHCCPTHRGGLSLLLLGDADGAPTDCDGACGQPDL